MSNSPTISVIVPIYNAESFLSECLDSILAQSYKDFEVLLIDDGSTDTSGRICDKYSNLDCRIRTIHQTNVGSSLARQVGINHCMGKYIAFVDADDWVEDNHLEQMKNLAEKECADIIICDFYVNHGEQEYIRKCEPSSYDSHTLQIEALNNTYHAGVVLKFFARKLFIDYDIVPAPCNYYEDMFAYISCLQYAKKIVHGLYPTYHYRYNENSQTNIKNTRSRINMFEEAMCNLRALDAQYRLTTDDALKNALYCCVNHNKSVLISSNYNNYKEIYPYLHTYYSMSSNYYKISDLYTWGISHALRGNIVPFYIYKGIHYIEIRTKKLLRYLFV